MICDTNSIDLQINYCNYTNWPKCPEIYSRSVLPSAFPIFSSFLFVKLLVTSNMKGTYVSVQPFVKIRITKW